MGKYRATVKVSNVEGTNPATAQETLEQCLKAAGLDGWRIVSIEEDAKKSVAPIVPPRVHRKTGPSVDPGTVLLVAAAALALLFFLSLAL